MLWVTVQVYSVVGRCSSVWCCWLVFKCMVLSVGVHVYDVVGRCSSVWCG